MSSSPSYVRYFAYRRAKAVYEALQYQPEYVDDDPPEEAYKPLSDAQADALDAFLLEPANDVADLARKLKVFRDEEIQKGWDTADKIVAALAADAHRIAYSGT